MKLEEVKNACSIDRDKPHGGGSFGLLVGVFKSNQGMGVRTCSLIGLKKLWPSFFLLFTFSLRSYAQTFGLK